MNASNYSSVINNALPTGNHSCTKSCYLTCYNTKRTIFNYLRIKTTFEETIINPIMKKFNKTNSLISKKYNENNNN